MIEGRAKTSPILVEVPPSHTLTDHQRSELVVFVIITAQILARRVT